ncbi:hypothetical protein [Flavobacterium luminosum]|uniref:Uncharacterized protein n=1 Tax=Flavobacterium luminosum TaxID=2949086 RepID=A0ABT0TQV4_9FLAO|nr:hypothetical protein [Flavobacterium sp. HXWNR70]MCL9809869.1 hypothetical protein [Flavobacterium sp. HXWNR70]
MAENNKHIFDLEILDHYLCSTGFICPTNELQLDLFEKLYDGFDYKLKDATIDVSAIINNQLSKKSVIRIFNEDNLDEIKELKMAARKGTQGLSQDIIDKMYGKHRKKSDDTK